MMVLLSGTKRVVLLAAFLAVSLPASVRAAAVSVLIQSAQGKGQADAVVTLIPVGHAAAPASIGKATIEQINKEFSPRVTVIATGSKVWLPNCDNIRHHVYSFSPAKKFDIKLYAGDPPAPVVFDKPGLVVLGCNIHDWMIAYVVVTDAPYYGKSDSGGNLVLANVASGEYEMHVWHPEQSGPEQVQKVRVGPDAASVQLRLDLKPSTAH